MLRHSQPCLRPHLTFSGTIEDWRLLAVLYLVLAVQLRLNCTDGTVYFEEHQGEEDDSQAFQFTDDRFNHNSLCASHPGARAYHAAHNPDPDNTSKQARRKLANKLVGILHGVLERRTPYNPDIAWRGWHDSVTNQTEDLVA